MERLDGRAAFITGGAQGIGLGIARALAKQGVRIALADINAPALEEAQAELSALTRAEPFVLDVRDRDQFASVADEAEHLLGPVSLLFNNAGVTDRVRATELTYEMWDWALGINLQGVINGIQTFMPRMLQRGGDAHIVNTSSGAGLVVVGAGVMYTTAKFAVVGLSESLRHGLARHGIGVSVLCPGYVATDIMEHSAALSPAGDGGGSAVPADRRERYKSVLAGGTPADAVGDMVIDAIRANRLYIYTGDEIAEHLQRRSEMLMDALSSLAPRAGSSQPTGGQES